MAMLEMDVYISRGTHMMVVDEVSSKVIGDIADAQGVHGIALATDLRCGFTSNGQSNTVTIIDLKTRRPISAVKVMGENPELIVFV